MKDRPAIIGVGAIRVGKYPSQTENELALEVIRLALDDAGLPKHRVQGLFTTPDLRGSAGLQLNLICEYLRLTPKIAAETSLGALAPGLAIRMACNEIQLGNIDLAVCYGAVREGSTGWFREITAGGGAPFFEPSALQPNGTPGVLWAYALSARRYMHETGATAEHFARAAVRNRDNAGRDPLAAFVRPISVQDVLASPELCSPIKLLDSAVSQDGAAAVVIASGDVARRASSRPVHLAGLGQYHDCSSFVPTDDCEKSISTFVSTREATQEALRQAGAALDDIDVAEVYAPFSAHELMVPEDIGWFERGGMIPALESGETSIGGALPINTGGGVLSRGHPWAVTPFYEVITIVRQLRGEAGENQVSGARTGLVHSEAGMLNNAMVLILSNDR